MAGFSTMALTTVAIQRLAFTMPTGSEGDVAFFAMMDRLHQTWIVFLPIMFVGGVVFVAAGFYLRRGSDVARRIAQLNALVGYAWAIGYSFSIYRGMAVMSGIPSGLSETSQAAIQWCGLIVDLAIPTGLLYLLRRPGESSAPSPRAFLVTDPTNHPANPYESPTVESEGATAGSEGAGFRWRLIPTAVLGLLGVCGVSCGLFAAVYVLIAFHVEGLSWVTVQMIAAMLIYLTPGILLLMAARYCWTGRTRAALIATALAAIVPPFLLAIFDN